MEQEQEKPTKKRKGCRCLLGVIAIILIIVAIFSPTPENEKKDKQEDYSESAYYMSQVFVDKYLKAPSTAVYPKFEKEFVTKFDSIPNLYTVKSYVDSQNSFGAMLRSKYSAVITRDELKEGEKEENRTWTVLALEIDGKRVK